MKIIIGSQNPAKVLAVQEAFKHYQTDFIPMNIPSGVSAQPFSDEETIQGAINRAYDALKLGEGHIGIGLEGGVQETKYGLFLCNWGALAEIGESPIIAGGARIPLPVEVADHVLAGEELGPVMENYVKKDNVRKKEGAVGIFTNNQINRAEMFTHVMKLLVGQYEFRGMEKR
ncbi:DUF84 family protein [Bacillus sp. FJAT-29790]|uniref:DUF84 family protein n=1 Tax=Bacillus sp. FJAT-29790 TaxID=1895002 RepID=UPI001C233F52|nr:DUF84 family protein [Bacillus sp. FJAT-29790]MBU8879771.1 DUF84 family protein [Bacillus sp. FJAT-29790]